MSILNALRTGKFSSDRTIEEYSQQIWNLKKVKVSETNLWFDYSNSLLTIISILITCSVFFEIPVLANSIKHLTSYLGNSVLEIFFFLVLFWVFVACLP